MLCDAPTGECQTCNACLPEQAERILEYAGVRTLKARLAELPGRLAEARERLTQARWVHEDAKLRVAEEEARLVLDIAADKNKYPNAEARAAELTRRKAEDPDYRAADYQLRVAEEQLSEAQDYYQALADEWAAVRALARIAAAELNLIAAFEPNGREE